MTETVEQFLARGGSVQRIPLGQCNWDALGNRAKINPQVREDERGARKMSLAAQPIARSAAKPLRRAAPKPPKARARRPHGLHWLRPEAKELLTLLPMHPTIPMLVAATGKSRKVIWLTLNRLRSKGLVESRGVPSALNTWHLTEAGKRR